MSESSASTLPAVVALVTSQYRAQTAVLSLIAVLTVCVHGFSV